MTRKVALSTRGLLDNHDYGGGSLTKRSFYRNGIPKCNLGTRLKFFLYG
jgi:hypothetical protein